LSTAVARPGAPADADLIQAVRDGDVDAFGDLFSRHVDAARRLGRQLVPAADVDDLVGEAFEKVLDALRHGGGPDIAFRAYLLTTLRRLHVDQERAAARLRTTDDLGASDDGVPVLGTAVAGFENRAAAEAFASLPEQWRTVLWHTEVEGQEPAEVAPLLGMSPHAVSALAHRAREGLRAAFLARHAPAAATDECRWTHAHLGAYVRGETSRRDTATVEEHLRECRPCTALHLELRDIDSDLGGLIAPLLLGPAAAGYLGATSTAPAGGGLLLGRGRAWIGTHSRVVGVTAGVAAATIVVAGATWALLGTGDDQVGTTAAGSSVASGPPETSADDPSVLTPVPTVGPRSAAPPADASPGDPPPSPRAGATAGDRATGATSGPTRAGATQPGSTGSGTAPAPPPTTAAAAPPPAAPPPAGAGAGADLSVAADSGRGSTDVTVTVRGLDAGDSVRLSVGSSGIDALNSRTGSCPIRPSDADPGCVLTGDSTVRLVARGSQGGGTLTFRLEPATGSRPVTVAVP
jgi:RNA polymerase sigma factor (sigma-70 family)